MNGHSFNAPPPYLIFIHTKIKLTLVAKMGEQLPHLLRRLKMWRQSCGENLLVTRGSLVAQTPTMGCRISLLHWGHRETRPAVHCCGVEPLCFDDTT